MYEPLKASRLIEKHEFFFPHDGDKEKKTKHEIKEADVVFAEVSLPGTGLGIELGWADAFDKKIVCLSKKGAHLSNSLKFVTKTFIEYEDSHDLVEKISEYLKKHA